ncbi:acyltransferase family protein [Kibdelosporangium persicum]|nr:acyltransferase family protein [Kibdelosporangium persicum]
MPGRDPTIDSVRAVAVVGVIAGHWLVTALVSGPAGLTVDSPLRHMPDLAPLSWVLQTLGLFFFAGGFAAARSKTGLWHKLTRLAVPVAVLLAAWALIIVVSGMPGETSKTVIHLVTSPLWFLGVYVVLQALTPAMSWLDGKLRAWALTIPVVLTVVGELTVNEITVITVWWAPWQAGILAARAGLRWGLPLLLGGALAYFLLVRYAGYPVSAVGGTGEARSNLAPPSPAALALAAAQVGAASLTVRRANSRLTRWINDRALMLFLVHQSALLIVVLTAQAFGVVPGLHTSPDDPMWPLLRLAWLPVFTATLFVLCTVPFGRTRNH